MKTKVLQTAFTLSILFGTFSCAWEQISISHDCSISPVELELLSSEDTGCGAPNGSFSVIASGGEPPYEYAFQSTSNADGSFQNVDAGSYSVTATDALGCTAQLEVNIQNLDGVNLNEVLSTDAGCGSSGGTIQIDASGGVAPYTYALNGGDPQSENAFSGLEKGNHTIKVIDNQGCEVTETVEILSGVSYQNSIKSIIENSCAVSGCHNGSVSPDLRNFGTIQARASSIKARTGNKSMPKGSSLSQQQIDMIACWVDDGAPAN